VTPSATGPVRVRIFTTRTCAYCVAAKRLLGARGVAFEEIDVTGDDAQRTWLVQTTGMRTVPQIFFRDQSIGGYRDLASLDRSGRLGAMLQDSATAPPAGTTRQARHGE
jgi:glutaredoxin 3